MTLSFFVPERSLVTTLPQKLNQLSLTSMARQLDQTIVDAAQRNRSFAETLESLVDFELEARNSRSIERRFRLSRLHAKGISAISSVIPAWEKHSWRR
jgi:DNA replication protein DnaC